jgi:hypothetical protein
MDEGWLCTVAYEHKIRATSATVNAAIVLEKLEYKG